MKNKDAPAVTAEDKTEPASPGNVAPNLGSFDDQGEDPAEFHALYRRSICLACRHRRTIVSGKGSVFLLCQSPAVEKGWPKYPPQPLASCRFLEKKTEGSD